MAVILSAALSDWSGGGTLLARVCTEGAYETMEQLGSRFSDCLIRLGASVLAEFYAYHGSLGVRSGLGRIVLSLPASLPGTRHLACPLGRCRLRLVPNIRTSNVNCPYGASRSEELSIVN